ncbi:MAG: D-inositol-3-phosphate glycosyltransferase [Chroococcopsis gigantea SAG 12.99]|jgi:glycosyltransferase involved in cell wall biosynthesis|nr:D-inositol-3-phosphate glycosyltransferase [Chroococcopsis gigantea SAG 12.99]
MKVLQIVPSLSLVYGGPSQMVLGLSAALAQLDAQVTILTTNSNGDNGQAPLDVPLGIPVEQNGYKVIYFQCSPFRRYKFSLDLFQYLSEHAPEYHIAHIHALFSPVSSLSAAIARYHSLPYILRPLGTLDPADLRKKKQLKQLYSLLLEKANLARAAGLHFTSAQECKISERFGLHTKDYIIPLGVDSVDGPIDIREVKQGLGIEEGIPLLLYMSRLDPKKGLDLLLPALEKLLAQGLDFHFVLAGGNPQDPEYEKQMQKQIETSSLAPCTTITGFVTGVDKKSLLKAADLFILPSRYENFGIAIAEAMAAGIPVVISDGVHIYPTIEEYGAGWVTSCDVEPLAQTIKTALENPTERKSRGEKGIRLVREKYSWSAIARQTLQMYREAIVFKN